MWKLIQLYSAHCYKFIFLMQLKGVYILSNINVNLLLFKYDMVLLFVSTGIEFLIQFWIVQHLHLYCLIVRNWCLKQVFPSHLQNPTLKQTLMGSLGILFKKIFSWSNIYFNLPDTHIAHSSLIRTMIIQECLMMALSEHSPAFNYKNMCHKS